MVAEGQTPEEARAGARRIVDEQMRLGNPGYALHTIQDMATPLHDGHVWKEATTIRDYVDRIEHFYQDMDPAPNVIVKAYRDSVQTLKQNACGQTK